MHTDPYAPYWPEESDFPFTTDNLVLARLLMTHGFEPLVEQTGRGKAVFQFPHTRDVGQIVLGYHYGSAMVDPDDYERARAALRRLMADAKGRK